MDRIMDSGSIDWGSTPHGRTFRAIKSLNFNDLIASFLLRSPEKSLL